MTDGAQPHQIPLKQKIKTLLRASTLATWYSSVAFLVILLLTVIYDEDMLSNFEVNAISTLVFFVGLQLAWLAGLLFGGLPVWIISEKLGWRRKWAARLLGAFPPLAFGLWAEHKLHFMEPWNVLIPIALFYIGSLIGKYVWKRHYAQSEDITPASEATR